MKLFNYVYKFRTSIVVVAAVILMVGLLTGCRDQSEETDFQVETSQELIDYVNENNEAFKQHREENPESVSADFSVIYAIGDGNHLLIITEHHVEIDIEQEIEVFEDSWSGNEEIYNEAVQTLGEELGVPDLRITFIIRDMNGGDIATRTFE